jgi:hypothetical protein
MFNRRVWVLSALCSVLIIAACGGHGHHGGGGGGGTTASSPQMSVTPIKGMHIHAAQSATATKYDLNWRGLMPTVEAASTVTVAVSQNWEGACTASPNAGQAVSFLVFGLGQNSAPNCSNFFFNDQDGSSAATNATGGKLVYGAGTLSNLVVSTDPGTNIQVDVPFTLWVRRSGTVINTGVTCSVPAGVDELLCQGTSIFALQNLDRVIAVGLVGANDHLVGLNVVFTKSIP